MKKENILPENWFETKLEEISDSVSTSGKKIKTKDALPSGKYPVIDQGLAPISGYVNDPSLLVPASTNNAVIIFGDHTRIVKYVAKDFVPGADGTKLIRAKNEIDSRYLKYLIQQADIPDRGYGRHYQFLKSANLPLAPANEQRRIADKLDTTLARVDALNDRLARITPLLKRFRQSVLAAATSGRLTEEWRARRDELELSAWHRTNLRSCIKSMKGGASPKVEDYSSSGTLALNKGDIKPYGYLNSKKNKKFLPKSFVESNSTKIINPGTLVVTLRDLSSKADFLGLISEYISSENAMITQGMYALELNSCVIKKYLIYFSNSNNYREIMKREKVGATQVHLRNDQFLDVPIALPSLEEQTEIVRRVETLFAFADRLEARLQSAQTAAERLTPALLAKAFRGELLPQDPNDEPAGALLARLANQRTISGKEKKLMRTHQPRTKRIMAKDSSMTKSRQDEDVKGKPYLADHLRRIGNPCTVESLFKAAELPIADFYKQLAWEIAERHVKDNQTTLEPGNAIG